MMCCRQATRTGAGFTRSRQAATVEFGQGLYAYGKVSCLAVFSAAAADPLRDEASVDADGVLGVGGLAESCEPRPLGVGGGVLLRGRSGGVAVAFPE